MEGKRLMTKLRWLAILIVCLFLMGCFIQEAGLKTESVQPSPEEPAVRLEAQPEEDGELLPVRDLKIPDDSSTFSGPVFTTVSLMGESVSENYFRSHKITMVNFWATWCGPCVYEIPALAAVFGEYAEQGFGLLGVMIDEDTDAAKELIEQCGIGYPVILANGDLLDMAESFPYVPTTVFFDEKGQQVGEVHVGSKDYEAWRLLVEELLGLCS